MELVLRALGLDVLPADADAQVDQAFRLSGLMSGQVEVRIRPENLPAALHPFAAWTQQAPLKTVYQLGGNRLGKSRDGQERDENYARERSKTSLNFLQFGRSPLWCLVY